MLEKRGMRRGLVVLGFVLAGYLAAMIPGSPPSILVRGERAPFAWDQDLEWARLERQYREQRGLDCASKARLIDASIAEIKSSLEDQALLDEPRSQRWRGVEDQLFQAALALAACPGLVKRYTPRYWSFREQIKRASVGWDLSDDEVRERLYRLLYGSRIALEQAMLISGEVISSSSEEGVDEPLQVPSIDVHGVRIQSGDLLLSRGTAPTSALIARGNNYPGNFSHVALVHIDDHGKMSVIESLIERGVVVTDVDGYLSDKKFRILVLRLRKDHPALASNPRLPHRAAEEMLERARAGHIPYDFDMDYKDNTALFCSEVAAWAYQTQGVTLWRNLTHISAAPVVRWMNDFGVRHFITQAPSDLEYDPSLSLVYEWVSKEGLEADSIDNAVIDAMLERNAEAASIKYNPLLLPIARLVKLYSWLQNRRGGLGKIPEGMSALAGLRNTAFQARHEAITARLGGKIARFRRENGYFPPYWELVKLAKATIDEA